MIALLLLLQTAPPQSFSILHEPCASNGTEVVVCARKPDRLPLPNDRGPPDGPTPSNLDLTGMGALAPVPCAARQRGCQVGVDVIGMGVAAVRLVGKIIDPKSCCDEPGQATNPVALIRDVAGAVRKKPDKAGRVRIVLDAPLPSTAGRLLP
jgi:hypothetical protein